MNVKVRLYDESDYEIVSKIISENFGGELKSKEKSPDNVNEFVCEVDGKIAGYYVLTEVKNVVRGYSYYLVDYVCVDKEMQGRGIGKVMMRHAITKVTESSGKYIQLTCSEERVCAHHLYESVGFQKRLTDVYRLVVNE